MVKKFFLAFLIISILVAVYSLYQKKNPALNKIFNRPTDSVQKVVNKLEKIFLQVSEPKNNITVNNPIININGKTISNAFIFINEQELKADVNGNFTTATTLEEGENYILIVASDDLGNSIEKDILVNLESTQ
jgi:hypothetical protein